MRQTLRKVSLKTLCLLTIESLELPDNAGFIAFCEIELQRRSGIVVKTRDCIAAVSPSETKAIERCEEKTIAFLESGTPRLALNKGGGLFVIEEDGWLWCRHLASNIPSKVTRYG
jgi:hypothetical protein